MKLKAPRGQVLPLVAISLIVLLGAAGFAVDVGYHQYRQRIQQTATDSAALAGAKELLTLNYVKAAQQDAANNGYTDTTNGGTCTPAKVCVQVSNPPVAPDAFATSPNANEAVEVIIRAPNATFFERLFGFNSVQISTKAVAMLIDEPNGNGCLYVLSGQANFNGQTGGGQVNADGCGLSFNEGANFHAATVDAAAINCAVACTNGTFTNAQPTVTSPASDPCPEIANCAYLESHPPTCSSHVTPPAIGSNGNAAFTPGCYNGSLNYSKATSVKFGCGMYVIDGTTLNISATGKNATPINVTQTCPTDGSQGGVTFYVTNGGSLVLKNDNIILAAPTSGDYTSDFQNGEQNVLVYQNPADTSTVNLQAADPCGQTCNSYFSGMIYAPSATLNFNQNNTTSSGKVLIIAGTLNANGGISSILAAPSTFGVPVKTAVLGE